MRKTIMLAAVLSAPMAMAKDVPSRPYLTLDAARSGVEACLSFARDNDLRVAVAVLDRASRPVAFARMDDVFQKQIELAGIKAETAAATPVSTKQWGEITSAGSPLEGLVQLPRTSRVEGGVPIKLASGYAIGGVGVSGATPAQDGECANTAVVAMREKLGD